MGITPFAKSSLTSYQHCLDRERCFPLVSPPPSPQPMLNYYFWNAWFPTLFNKHYNIAFMVGTVPSVVLILTPLILITADKIGTATTAI